MMVHSLSDFVNLIVGVRSTKEKSNWTVTVSSNISNKVEFWKTNFNVKDRKDLCLFLHSSRRDNKTGRHEISCFNSFSFWGNDNGNDGGGGGGGGGGGDDDEGKDDDKSKEHGIKIMSFEEMVKEAEARVVTIPNDIIAVSWFKGFPKHLFLRYLDLQGSAWPLGFAMRSFPWLRNLMLADPAFLVKLTTEFVVYACGVTIGHVYESGNDFRTQFEMYATHLFGGLLTKVAVICLTAPTMPFGQSKGIYRDLLRVYSELPEKFIMVFFKPDGLKLVHVYGARMILLYFSVAFACSIGTGIMTSIRGAALWPSISTFASRGATETKPFSKGKMKTDKDGLLPFILSRVDSAGGDMIYYGAREMLIKMLCWAVLPGLYKVRPNVCEAVYHGLGLASGIYSGMFFVDLVRDEINAKVTY